MGIDTGSIRRDFEEMGRFDPPPTKRAAYSDRTAWLMSNLCSLAYLRFEDTDPKLISEAAKAIAEAAGVEAVESELQALSGKLRSNRTPAREIISDVLAVAGFELVGDGVFAKDDTEGFLAANRTEAGPNMAVLVFRGTTSMTDWKTNLQGSLTEPDILKRQLGEVKAHRGSAYRDGKARLHRGFLRAFETVEEILEPMLKEVEDLPLYITGHSLGGAVAVVATWKNSAYRNAACYTFGSPRVGNGAFAERFKTPIYRIVNGPDPVPFVPPRYAPVVALAWLLGLLPHQFGPKIKRWLISRFAGYRHYGTSRTLHHAESRFVPEFTVVERIWVFVPKLLMPKHLFEYHQIGQYSRKLGDIARARNSEK